MLLFWKHLEKYFFLSFCRSYTDLIYVYCNIEMARTYTYLIYVDFIN